MSLPLVISSNARKYDSADAKRTSEMPFDGVSGKVECLTQLTSGVSIEFREQRHDLPFHLELRFAQHLLRVSALPEWRRASAIFVFRPPRRPGIGHAGWRKTFQSQSLITTSLPSGRLSPRALYSAWALAQFSLTICGTEKTTALSK